MKCQLLFASSKQRENFGSASRFNVVVGFGLKVTFKNQSYHHDHLSKDAKIRNRSNQVPHLTQDTNEKVTNSQSDTTNESQEVSPFPAGDHKAHINRHTQRQANTRQKSIKDPQHCFLGGVLLSGSPVLCKCILSGHQYPYLQRVISMKVCGRTLVRTCNLLSQPTVVII